MRVLVVEDDAMIALSLDRALSHSGIAVDWVKTGTDCLTAIQTLDYDLLLLDLGLPDISGLKILERIRGSDIHLPVVIITARDEVGMRVAGLDGGADDYVMKPFDFDELNARIRAVVRRLQGRGTPSITAGEVHLDLVRQEVTFRAISHVLSSKEFALVRALAERPGAILSRSQLEDRLYGWGDEVESNAIDVLIYYVRRKFGKDIIRNVRGIGWMIPEHTR